MSRSHRLTAVGQNGAAYSATLQIGRRNKLRYRALQRALAIFALAAAAGTAEAHEVRFIASYGNNADLCTRDAPCLTLQRGINITPAGGELIILDSGDYGNNSNIRKSLAISAVGVSATLGGPITIDDANATVVLRGLRLNGVTADASANGLHIMTAAAVHVEDCEVQGFGGAGIISFTAPNIKLFVSSSVVRINGGTGLHLAGGVGATLTVDNSRFEHNGNNGLYIQAVEATITRTIASGNNGDGIIQFAGSTNITWTTAANNGSDGYSVSFGQMTLEQSAARGNNVGLRNSVDTATVSNSTLTNNFIGVIVGVGSSTVLTRGNNLVSGNTTDVSGILTPLGGI
jgi:hypothetical protein